MNRRSCYKFTRLVTDVKIGNIYLTFNDSVLCPNRNIKKSIQTTLKYGFEDLNSSFLAFISYLQCAKQQHRPQQVRDYRSQS